MAALDDGCARSRSNLPRFELGYRPPYDWEAIRDFFRARAVPGVEYVENDAYLRTLRCGEHTRLDSRRSEPERPLARARGLAFARRGSSDHRGAACAGSSISTPTQLSSPRGCAEIRGSTRLVKLRPGLRVPRAFDAAEIAARAILGQQVTVAAARTLAGRLARAFGDAIETPFDSLDRLWPTAARLAALADASLRVHPPHPRPRRARSVT